MQADHPITAIKAFLAYLALGYLALALHRWVFEPQLEEAGGGLRVALVMVNLLAGSWCFVCALRSAWSITHREDSA